MGANFVTLNYEGTKEQIAAKFHKDQDQDRYENGHSYSGGIGMATGLRFESTYEATTEDEATAWLDEHCHKWEEAIAVRLKGTDKWVVGAVCSA
jgi:hypothetical protein